jgi:hypothetical protein
MAQTSRSSSLVENLNPRLGDKLLLLRTEMTTYH